MNDSEFKQLQDDVEFMNDMFIMTCSSSRLSFLLGVESLEDRLADADEDLWKSCREILRVSVSQQLKEFQDLFDRIDRSTGKRLCVDR